MPQGIVPLVRSSLPHEPLPGWKIGYDWIPLRRVLEKVPAEVIVSGSMHIRLQGRGDPFLLLGRLYHVMASELVLWASDPTYCSTVERAWAWVQERTSVSEGHLWIRMG